MKNAMMAKLVKTQIDVEGKTYDIYVQQMSVAAHERLKNDKSGNESLKLVASSVCNEHGEPIFTTDEVANLKLEFYSELAKIVTEQSLGKLQAKEPTEG